ncbi:MAG: hypothetical protein KGI98_17160 [Euryarchaeota archaeon]|nr:hypothetical protein [Euryarchaeota archaeon]
MSDAQVQDPLGELQRENEVTQGLLERILEEAQGLKGGKDVPPGEVSEGLRLFDQYRHLHIGRMDVDLQTEARPVAMSTCFEHLDKMPKDHEEVSRLLEAARGELGRYEARATGARDALARALEALANHTFEVRTHEGDYALSCLVTALPEEASMRLAEKFDRDQSKIADLDAHIQRYLATPVGEAGSTIKVACAHSGCASKSQARVVPATDGRLGLILPAGGWQVASQEEQPRAEGRVHVHLHFHCPEHATVLVSGEQTPSSGLLVWADDGGRTSSADTSGTA